MDEDRGFARRDGRPEAPGQPGGRLASAASWRHRPAGWRTWDSAHLADWRPAELGTVVATMVVAVLAILLNVQEMLSGGDLARPLSVLALAALAGLWVLLMRRAFRKARMLGFGVDRLERFGNSLADPHFMIAADGSTAFVNTAFSHRFSDGGTGMSPLEALRACCSASASGTERFEELEASAAKGRRARAEIAVPDASGGSAWLRISVSPLDGPGSGMIWSVEDVTDRRALFEVVQTEQRKLVELLDHVPFGFYSVDVEGRFLLANAVFAKWLGRPASELMQGELRLHDLLSQRPPAEVPGHVPFGEAEREAGEVEIRTADGSTVRLHVSQSIFRDPETGERKVCAVVRDLRPEHEMKHALEVSEQRFERVFEEAPVGVILLGADCIIHELNTAFASLIGGGRQALLGADFCGLAVRGEVEALRAKLRGVYEGRNVPMPIEMRLAGAGERSCAVYASTVDGTEEEAHLMLHLIDTTQQKKLELQFAQSQKMLAVGQLAGGVAHDFNNLLTAMIGFCDLLLLRHQPGDPSFADIIQIKQNANRAANLVRQLLAFSRQQTLQPRVLNLTDVLADLSNLLRRLIGASIELKMQYGRDLGLVKVDQMQLEQVIMNLAVNGRDAMPDGGVLEIRTGNVTVDGTPQNGREAMTPGEYVLIEVRDTGTGIAKEHLDRIFEPFFSTKEVGSGTGLGLSTVYGIVKQTGGFIFVDSEPGQGATFSIYLPRFDGVADQEKGARADAAVAADLTGAGTVLLVEDEDPVRLFSARALRNKGYKVLEARSGDVALEMLESEDEPIDIMITDVVMPKMDGPTLIGRVRETRPDLKIICISGYAEGSFRQKLAGFPDVEFLPKPFSLQQLATKVKDVMSGTRTL